MSSMDTKPATAVDAPPRWAFVVYLVRGGLALTFGVAVLVFGTGLARLCTFVALYAVAAGAVTLHWFVRRRGAGGPLALVVGLLWVGTGVAVLLRGPLEGAIGEGVLLNLFAVVAITTGVIRVTGHFHDDQLAGVEPRRRYRFVVGPLDVLLGLAVLVADEHTSAGIRVTLGVWGLVTAAFLILDGLEVRRADRPAGCSEAAHPGR
jgi:uncharacterized membrane protein HdeD (DUF308 family)